MKILIYKFKTYGDKYDLNGDWRLFEEMRLRNVAANFEFDIKRLLRIKI